MSDYLDQSKISMEKKQYEFEQQLKEIEKDPMKQAVTHEYTFHNSVEVIEEERKKLYPKDQVSILSGQEQQIATDFRLR